MNRLILPLFFVLFSLLVSSCSLPRVMILKDPLTPEEHVRLGFTYEKQGALDDAIHQYELAAKKLPRAYLYLANSYFQKGEWKKAEKNYRLAIREEPGEADAYNNLAWLYYTRKENLPRAEDLARRALELNPAKEELYRDTLEKIREARESPQPGKESR